MFYFSVLFDTTHLFFFQTKTKEDVNILHLVLLVSERKSTFMELGRQDKFREIEIVIILRYQYKCKQRNKNLKPTKARFLKKTAS